MARLIDADALMEEFAEFVAPSNRSDFEPVPTWNDAVSLLDSAPTIEAIPIDEDWETGKKGGLISKGKLLSHLFSLQDEPHDIALEIANFPEVEIEPKRGRWIRKESKRYWWYECSECGKPPMLNGFKQEELTDYCPHCGADMRERKEDGKNSR